MFPTPRLLIGAIFASLVALTCGFAVFAAFRVNHEPLSRLPAVTAPLQLLADENASAAPVWSADEGLPYRPQQPLRLSQAQTGGMGASPPAVTPVRLEAVDAPHPGSARAAKTEKTGKPTATLREHRGAAVASAVAVASPAVAPSVAVTPPPAPAARLPVTVTPPPAAAAAPLPPAPTKPSAPGAVKVASAPASTLVPATAASRSAPPATRPVTGMTTDAGAKTGGAAKPGAKPVIAAIAPPAVERPAAIAGAISQTPASQAKSPAKALRKSDRRTAGKLGRRPIERWRVAVKRRRIRRMPAYAGTRDGPDSSYQEPAFRSAPGYQPQSQDSSSYGDSFRWSGGY